MTDPTNPRPRTDRQPAVNGAPESNQPAWASSGGQYEFSAVENQTVDRAAFWAKALALVLFVNAGLQIINLNVVGIIIDVAVGIVVFQVANALSQVVESQGNDISHMMDAMKSLSSALLIRVIVTGVGFVLLMMIALGFLLAG